MNITIVSSVLQSGQVQALQHYNQYVHVHSNTKYHVHIHVPDILSTCMFHYDALNYHFRSDCSLQSPIPGHLYPGS